MHLHLSEFVFLAGFVAYVILRAVFQNRTKDNEKTLRRMDALELTLLWIVGIGNVLLPVLYLASPWFSFADYRLPPAAQWCGLPVMAAALWLFWRAHADLGLNWSQTLELRKGHQLITHGIFRRIRHPMYAAIWLFGLCQGLLLHNWFAGWSGVTTFAIMYFIRVPREERMMQESFGQEYTDYMRRTGKILPRFRA
jgi:protein-S-isoprenylcysteine O-methyltransferase Ste14